jgi:hypothetical protein
MSDQWRPIDDQAKSGKPVKVRFPHPGSKSEILECKARYTGGGAWMVIEHDKNGGMALNAIEWRPIRADE